LILVKPNGSVRLVELDFAGRLAGFTLLFKSFILMLTRQTSLYPSRPLPEKQPPWGLPSNLRVTGSLEAVIGLPAAM
jgi:hypothetical protein